MYDIITIGGATQDIFVEIDEAKVLNMETISSKQSYLCFDYGAKIEMDQIAYDIGGGAANAAVNLANLGLKTGIIVKTGTDLTSKAVLQRFEERNVDNSMVIQSKKHKTGFSVILVSYEGDRTVLMHRGANNTISLDEIDLEKIKQSKWVYVASLSGASNDVLDKFVEFAEENGINMAFNPGTTQIKQGVEHLKKILEKAEILVLNRSEASIITGIDNNPPEYPTIEDDNLIKMIEKLKQQGSKVVVITEGKKGAYAFDGKTLYYSPTFPSKVVSTLGAGDAFSSTFTASMIKYDRNIEKSLKMASINSAAVVESFGAQTGLKNFDELENIYNQNKDFKVLIKKKD
ncbi:MAG: hypothetical protein A2104_09350 [Candidatus Melainabacteria bacterium GWF2_32_7]|nr:MAG: hypothetical protein A2104_09350 [Candidatus Melainabacteria bacterium GWF2_32_7]